MVKRVAQLFRPYRGQVGLVFLSILVTGALGVAPAFITKAIINRALIPHDLHLLWRLVLLMIAIPLVSGAIGVGQTYLTTVVGQRVMQDLRNRLYEHLQAMSLRFFTGARTGDLQSRLQNDVGGVQSVVTNTASSVLSNVVTVLSTVVALLFLVAGYSNLSLGTIVAFTTLQTRLLFPIGNMLQTSVEVQSSLALFERIFAYLDLEQDIVDAPGARELAKERVRGEVELDDVYFRYEEPVQPAALEAQAVEVDGDGDGSRPVVPREWTLEDVRLEIAPGQLAAIVGPSGAGKTTISYLVPRLYDVTRGAVRIDGVDVREIM